MLPSSEYNLGLAIAWSVRVLIMGSLIACALMLPSCTTRPLDVFKTSPPADIIGGSEARTRNDQPHSGGSHEKSGSTPREPLQ
jgi:hypothetical protein